MRERLEEEELRRIEAGGRDNYDDAVDTIRALAQEVRALQAEMVERENAAWAEFAGVADLLGHTRARAPDFGEVDVVEVRALATRLRTRASDQQLLVHALMHRLGYDDTELSHREVMRAAEKCETHELILTEREGWTSPVRVETWLRFRRA